jgi:indole-3-glycerol phosphate synthase
MRLRTLERVDAARRAVPERELQAAAARAPAPADFAAALRRPRGETIRVVAEVKRASPSEGAIREVADPASLADRMTAGGIAAVSVLTEPSSFGGSLDDLDQVTRRVAVPVLRKDFILDPYQALEARAAGASACLLIVAFLERGELAGLVAAVEALGMTALVEAHAAPEIAAALAAGARVIGVNNRDLSDLEVRMETALRLRPLIPPGIASVAESGYRNRAAAAQAENAGYDAILVGTAVMRQADPARFVRELRGLG